MHPIGVPRPALVQKGCRRGDPPCLGVTTLVLETRAPPLSRIHKDCPTSQCWTDFVATFRCQSLTDVREGSTAVSHSLIELSRYWPTHLTGIVPIYWTAFMRVRLGFHSIVDSRILLV
jgi:hypothetical protein